MVAGFDHFAVFAYLRFLLSLSCEIEKSLPVFAFLLFWFLDFVLSFSRFLDFSISRFRFLELSISRFPYFSISRFRVCKLKGENARWPNPATVIFHFESRSFKLIFTIWFDVVLFHNLPRCWRVESSQTSINPVIFINDDLYNCFNRNHTTLLLLFTYFVKWLVGMYQ